MSTPLQHGETRTYISDYSKDFKLVCGIPPAVALAWVDESVPGVNMGNDLPACKLTTTKYNNEFRVERNNDTDIECNGWLNKLFVVIEDEYCRVLAISKHDGRFLLYEER
jgi:hypothetical protein